MDLINKIIGNKMLVGVVIGKLKDFMTSNKMDVFMIRRDENDCQATDGIVVSAFAGKILIVSGEEDIAFVRQAFEDREAGLIKRIEQSEGEEVV